jgi:hypothetical protein
MSRFNTLLHGEASEAADIMAGDHPPDTMPELRAALTNALNRIDRLEKQIEVLDIIRKSDADAICRDCMTKYFKDAIGTVCECCHRGIVEAMK